MDWVIDGIEPDEHDTDEKDRRPAAIEWHGDADQTEADAKKYIPRKNLNFLQKKSGWR